MRGRLRDDHDDLRRIMREFAWMMESSTAADLPQVTQRRAHFSHEFRKHMGSEDVLTLALRKGSLAAQAEPVIRQHGEAMRELFLAYSDHIKSWTPPLIVANWAGYRTAVLALQGRLYERMEWEEATLHPLIERSLPKAV